MDYEKRLGKWQKLWEIGVYKNWHLSDRNPDLWKFLNLLCPNKKGKAGVFLVPMCGKCLDMKLLYEEGFTVLGIEFCENTAQDFFKENDLPYEAQEGPGAFKVFSTADGKLRIACGDILAATQDLLGPGRVSMVWDRGAFGSIEKENRKSYARVMKGLMQGSKVRYLLSCWEFNDWYKSYPPHDCPKEMIHELYSDRFTIEELQRTVSGHEYPWFEVPTAERVVYLMVSKP